MKKKMLSFTIAIILGLLCLTTFAGAKKIVPADDLVDIINYNTLSISQIELYSSSIDYTVESVQTPNGTNVQFSAFKAIWTMTKKMK